MRGPLLPVILIGTSARARRRTTARCRLHAQTVAAARSAEPVTGSPRSARIGWLNSTSVATKRARRCGGRRGNTLRCESNVGAARPNAPIRNRGPFRRVALRGTIQRWISLRVTLGAPRATDRAFHAVPPKDIRETLSRSLALLCVSAPRGPQAPSRLVEHLHFHVLT